MSSRTQASIVMLLATLFLVVYDIILFLNNTPDDTFSEILKDAGFRIPAIPWTMGLLASHWFWVGTKYLNFWTLVISLSVSCVLFLAPVYVDIHPLVSLLIGGLVGRVLWAQDRKK